MSVNTSNNVANTTQSPSVFWKQKVPPVKYAGIITGFVLFSTLSATAFIYNYASVCTVKEAQLYADFSARQGLLTQSISSQMMKVERLNNSKKDDKENAYNELETSAQRLNDSITEFDNILNTLRGSGTLTNTLGEEVSLDAISDPNSVKHLNEIKELWTPYKNKIATIITSIENKDTNIDTEILTDDYPHFFNELLIKKIQLLEGSSLEHFQSVQKSIRNLQIIGLFIVFMLSIFAVWVMCRFLKEDDDITLSKQQTDEMLSHMTQGLCLLDKNLIISKQHSQALKEITQQQDVTNKSFTEVLASILSAEDVTQASDFLHNVYQNSLTATNIQELNPLQAIEVQLQNSENAIENRYLNFQFFPILQNNQVVRLLVHVLDITKQTEERQTNVYRQTQLQMLKNLVRLDFDVLQGFISKTLKRLDSINEILTQPAKTARREYYKVEDIHREVINIKRDSVKIDVEAFAVTIKNLELHIKELLEKSNLAESDFSDLYFYLDDLFNLTLFVEQLINPNSEKKHRDTTENTQSTATDQPTIEQLSKDTMTDPTLVTETETSDRLPTQTQADSETKTNCNEEGSDNNTNNIVHNSTDNLMDFNEDYHHLAKEIASRHQKQVRFKVFGFEGDIYLSKKQQKVIEEIVIELLRNAVVHGIELPEIREQHYKSKVGQVMLTLEKDNQDLVLTMTDDGQGINYDKVRQTALNNKDHDLGDVQNWSKTQLLPILFIEGFSTVSEKSQDAGSGLGMDTIKTLVTQLDGRLRIASECNLYSRFSITFPSIK